ncbi:7043_t:CDS:2, partial [Racocetra fulgida]
FKETSQGFQDTVPKRTTYTLSQKNVRQAIPDDKTLIISNIDKIRFDPPGKKYTSQRYLFYLVIQFVDNIFTSQQKHLIALVISLYRDNINENQIINLWFKLTKNNLTDETLSEYYRILGYDNQTYEQFTKILSSIQTLSIFDVCS